MKNRLIILLVSIYFFVCTTLFAQPPILNMIQGGILKVYFNEQYFELVRAELFYGYSLLDDKRVFVAYQGKDAEASAIIKLFNLTNHSEKFLLELPAAGETSFHLNSETKDIVFNDFDGIKILKINEDDTYKITTVVESEGNTFAPFWVNKNTVGYNLYEADKWVLKRITISK